MAEATTSKILKLNNNNYPNWKFKMELLLRKQNLWKRVILGEKPKPKTNAGLVENQKEIESWEDLDDEARGTIGLCVEDDQLAHIRTETTAKATWDALKNYHERNTLRNKVFLMRSICSLKLEEGGDAKEHINQMQDYFTKLRDIGEETLSDKWSAAMWLSSLPESYDALITSLESRKEDEITFALVQQRVIAEYDRHSIGNGHLKDSVLKTVGKDVVCYFIIMVHTNLIKMGRIYCVLRLKNDLNSYYSITWRFVDSCGWVEGYAWSVRPYAVASLAARFAVALAVQP